MSSTITVTATVQDPSSTSLAGNCFVRFRLRNFAGFVPQVSGTSILPEIQVDAVPVAGAVSQTLWPNNAITPSTTFYTVELWNQGRITSSGNYIFNASTSLNSVSQVNTPPVPAGFSLVLENNGVLNSSQSTLNLESTDATVTITDVGGGTLNLHANTTLNGIPNNYVWSFDSFRAFGGSVNNGMAFGKNATAPGSNNTVLAIMFLLPFGLTIKTISARMGSTNGGKICFAIYDSTGQNKLLDAGTNAFDGNTSGAQTVTLTTPIVLPAGTYWAASGATVANTTSAEGWAPGDSAFWNNVITNRVCDCSNAISGGAMPASLGTLTANSTTLVPGFFLTA